MTSILLTARIFSAAGPVDGVAVVGSTILIGIPVEFALILRRRANAVSKDGGVYSGGPSSFETRLSALLRTRVVVFSLRRLVARLRALRPGLVLAHVVLGRIV